MTGETNTDPGTAGMATLNEEDILRHVMSRIGELGERVTALESARVTPAEARVATAECANCDHERIYHHPYCHANTIAGTACPCQSFVDPTPVEAQESEPVCACGHTKEGHEGFDSGDYCRYCTDCNTYRPAAPPVESEPVCVYCHHPRDWHKGGIGNCDHCPCVGFSAAPPAPEPVPTVALDLVLEVLDTARELVESPWATTDMRYVPNAVWRRLKSAVEALDGVSE